jgi:hypothetical protein
MANFKDLSLELIKLILTQNNINRQNAKSLGVICRVFHRALEDIFPPTINLSGRFTVQILHNLSVDFESNLVFSIKVRRIVSNNSTSCDEQLFFQLMDDLLSRLQNIREISINLTHKRSDNISSSLISYLLNLSYQQRISLTLHVFQKELVI